MKLSSFSFILSLLLYISIEPIIQVNAAKCWDHNNPLEPWKKTASSICGTQKKSDGPNLTVGLGNTDKASSSFIAPPNAFQFIFTCGEKDPNLCNRAKDAFESAGLIIAKVINFNKPLVVNATFTNFCKSLGECGGKILGAASAARTIPLLDDDNNIRQYPQALAKQFLLNPEPEWGPFDIQAFFNSEFNLFFPNDTNIQPNQVDFQYIILHELIHGLGFASSWNSYFSGDGGENVALTSEPGFLDDLVSPNQQVTFTGFVETAFDKYMVNAKIKGQSPKRMSDFTASLNSFAKIGTTFPNVQSLLSAFQDSDSFQVASSLIVDSQTSKTFAFQPHDANNTNDLVFLETNIKFQQGSSISHSDIIAFNNTPDFLEVFNAKRGQTLDQLVSSVGGSYPIGPKLLSVLETLGYATANNPNPYSPRLPDSPKLAAKVQPPLPVAGDNNSKMSQTPASTATSLTSSFNILYVFIIVAVILLF